MSNETSSGSFSPRDNANTRLSGRAPWLDWMLTLQHQMLSMQQQAMSLYSLPASFARSAFTANNGAYTTTNGSRTGRAAARNEEVVSLGRETLEVDTRIVNQGTTRVRRFVVETPVEEKVALRQERVIVERRRPLAISDTGDTLVEKIIEMSDTNEVPVVWTKLELAEEIVLRREVNERVETVRGVVRHDEVEINEIGQNRALVIPPAQGLKQPSTNQPSAHTAANAEAPATAAKTQALLTEAKATFGGHESKSGEPSKTASASETKPNTGHGNEAHRSGKN